MELWRNDWMCDSQAFKYDKKLSNCQNIHMVCERARVPSTHHRHPRLAPHCWLSSTRWRSCTHCSPDAYTCWPPPGLILGQRGPRRSRPSCQTDINGRRQTLLIKTFFYVTFWGFLCIVPFVMSHRSTQHHTNKRKSQWRHLPLWDLLQHLHQFGGQAQSPELGGDGQSSHMTMPLLTSHWSLCLPHDCRTNSHPDDTVGEKTGLIYCRFHVMYVCTSEYICLSIWIHTSVNTHQYILTAHEVMPKNHCPHYYLM